MSTQTAEITTAEALQTLLRGIAGLSGSSLRRLSEVVEEMIDEEEDAEDAAYIEAHKDEPTIPFEEAVREFEAEHGPLYQN